MLRRSIKLVIVLGFAGCGTSEPPPAGGSDGGSVYDSAVVADTGGGIDVTPPTCTTGRYLPLATGNTWTYEITDPTGANPPAVKSSTVGPLEDLGGPKAGTLAFRVTTEKPGGGMTVSWQEDVGTAIVRHHELDMSGQITDEWYTPYKLRIDESPEHTVLGATYTVNYTEEVTDVAMGTTTTAAKSETWTVEGVDVTITVPAGTYCALLLHRTGGATGGGSDKRFWFVRGVGKAKEEGTSQIEVLTAYDLP